MRSQAAVQSFYPAVGEYDFGWVAEASKTLDKERLLFVDVAGGNGHAVRAICTHYHLSLDRCVLQDMESVINDVTQAGGLNGLQVMAIDLHREQPVKGLFWSSGVFWWMHNAHVLTAD